MPFHKEFSGMVGRGLVGFCLLIVVVPACGDSLELLKSSGVEAGLVVHLNCGDGVETVRLSANERLLVQGPFGVAFVNGRKIVKPWPDNMDEWNHFLNGPGNNAVAKDSVIGIPRSIQWVSTPRWGRSHEELAGMSAAVSAKGRVFFIFDKAPHASIRYSGQWELVGRDAFNGTLLWTKTIEKWNDHLRHFRSGPVHLPHRLVAVDDTVYATLGIDAPVSAIDAATGRTIRVYEGTERTEEILVQDGVLYLVVRAKVLTSDKLVIAGVPDVGRKNTRLLVYENEAETLAAFKGEKGVFLQVVSSSDGEVLEQCKLGAMPVFDGMSAAAGRIFVPLKDGNLQCWGSESRGGKALLGETLVLLKKM